MTNNKLPVIGKRYKTLEKALDIDNCDVDSWSPKRIICFISDYLDGSIDEDDYNCLGCDTPSDWRNCGECGSEELPDQEPTTKESLTVDKAQYALKKVKWQLDNNHYNYEKNLWSKEEVKIKHENLSEAVQNLVNALEENKYPLVNQAIQENPISSTVEHTSKSIWKPISELPDTSIQQFIICWEGGQKEIILYDECGDFFTSLDRVNEYCKTEITKYCNLTDFINQQETLKKRIERLEQLNKGE